MSDPFDAPYWNLPQILAWIFLGDRSLVRDMADEPRDRGRIWVWERTADGEERVSVRRPAPSLMGLSVAGHGESSRHYPSLKKAKEALSVELQNGNLTFLGIRGGRGELEEIPAEQWSDLWFYDDPVLVASKSYPRRGAVRWHKVRGRREEVLAIWPDKLAAHVEPGATLSRQKRFSEAAVRKWYKKRASKWKAGSLIPSREDDLVAARAEISDTVSRDFMRELRREYAPPGQKGRRPTVST